MKIKVGPNVFCDRIVLEAVTRFVILEKKWSLILLIWQNLSHQATGQLRVMKAQKTHLVKRSLKLKQLKRSLFLSIEATANCNWVCKRVNTCHLLTELEVRAVSYGRVFSVSFVPIWEESCILWIEGETRGSVTCITDENTLLVRCIILRDIPRRHTTTKGYIRGW